MGEVVATAGSFALDGCVSGDAELPLSGEELSGPTAVELYNLGSRKIVT